MNEPNVKQKRLRGTGSVFKMKNSAIWWIKYHRNGVPVRESSHSIKARDAERLLHRRFGELEAGNYVGQS